MAQHVGKVAWFNNARGFGFITRQDGPDVFCHYSSIQHDGFRRLDEGEAVEFDIEPGTTGRLQAVNVVRTAAKGKTQISDTTAGPKQARSPLLQPSRAGTSD